MKIDTDLITSRVYVSQPKEKVRKLMQTELRKSWLKAVAVAIGMGVILSLFAVVSTFLLMLIIESAFVAVAINSVLIAFYSAYVLTLGQIQKTVKDDIEYEYLITDEAWIVKMSSGTLHVAPWSAIRIVDETEEVLTISWDDSNSMVYREHLQKAGLEGDFRRLISK